MRTKYKIQVGDRFDRLVVEEDLGVRPERPGAVVRRRMFRCKCTCGSTVVVAGSYLWQGRTRSCGCWHDDRARMLNFKHGDFGTPLYSKWVYMKARCRGYNARSRRDYVERGITMCKVWQSWPAFKKWALSSGYRDGLTLDRINNDKGYSPSNCRWATVTQQNNNQRKTRWVMTPQGRMSFADAVRFFGVVSYSTASARLADGWDPLAAVSKPLAKRGKQ